MARELRSAWGGALLLVAITGYGRVEDRRFAAGFDAHFTKPVDYRRLQQLVAERAPGR